MCRQCDTNVPKRTTSIFARGWNVTRASQYEISRKISKCSTVVTTSSPTQTTKTSTGFARSARRLDPLRRVLLGNLVVEEAGRVRCRHETAMHLGIDAAVLEHLAVRHLDLERARLLVVS